MDNKKKLEGTTVLLVGNNGEKTMNLEEFRKKLNETLKGSEMPPEEPKRTTTEIYTGNAKDLVTEKDKEKLWEVQRKKTSEKKMKAPTSLVKKRRRLRQDVIDNAKRLVMPSPATSTKQEANDMLLKLLQNLENATDALIAHEVNNDDKYTELKFPAIECPDIEPRG